VSIEVCVGSRGTVLVTAWLAGRIISIVDVLLKCRLTTLRRCAGEHAISVVVEIKTMAAVVVVFKLESMIYLDFC
jgi:hypothetical protein